MVAYEGRLDIPPRSIFSSDVDLLATSYDFKPSLN